MSRREERPAGTRTGAWGFVLSWTDRCVNCTFCFCPVISALWSAWHAGWMVPTRESSPSHSGPAPDTQEKLDKTTRHLEIHIQLENAPVPGRKALRAIAEPGWKLSALRGSQNSASTCEKEGIETTGASPPAPSPCSVENWNLTFVKELRRAAPPVIRGERFCPSDCGGRGGVGQRHAPPSKLWLERVSRLLGHLQM